ncbi:hypothetical protein ACOMHN_057144 [Nucella lapillus]
MCPTPCCQFKGKREEMKGEKQVQLGNLDNMTVQQLQELLDRQQKLLSKQRFLLTLPDGGQKVKEFAAKLQHMISQRQNGYSTQNQPPPHPESSTRQQPSDQNRQTDSVTDLQSATDITYGAVPKSGVLSGKGEAVDSTAELSNAIDSLVLSELTAPRMTDKCDDRPNDEGNLETRFPNSYEKIIKQNQTSAPKRIRFKPNSSLKIADIQQLPDEYKWRSRSTASGSSDSVPVAFQPSSSAAVDSKKAATAGKVPEESAVVGLQYKYHGAKEIGLQESLALQKQQKENLEKIQTLHAAERLAERLNIKTVDYNPSAMDMQYRNNPSSADDGDTYDTDSDDDAVDDDDDVPD